MNRTYWLGLAGLLSTGLAAAEPAPTDEEPSLELLEFLAEYGTDSGELELPAELDTVNAVANTLPTREQTAAPATTVVPAGKGDQKP